MDECADGIAIMKSLNEKKPSRQLPATRIEFVNDEIYISRDGMAAEPLLRERRFAVEISEDARCHIARTISRLLPDVIESKKAALIDYSVRVLQVLCRDQILRVREILSEEMHTMEVAPHEIMLSLARDESASVAIPVLECSPVLTDQDLVEIIKTSSMPEVLEAIASRKRLSGMVSHALANMRLPKPLEKLLGNVDAEINEPSYDIIAEIAEHNEPLHIPLATRPDLPIRLINKIASFLSASVMDVLMNHYNLSPAMKEKLQSNINERLSDPRVEREKSARHSVSSLHSTGSLDDGKIEAALNMGDYAFVTQALAKLSGFSSSKVERILRSENAKAVTALCWKAGISMRNCLQVQTRISKIHHAKLLHARKGTDYPITQKDADIYLDLFS